MAATNIHTEFHRFLNRQDKESLLGQRGLVIWMYGLSGSGKSTIANAAERALHEEGRFTVILDGDNLRSGLNGNLGFSDEDRLENVRRVSETAKVFAANGIITFVSVITPALLSGIWPGASSARISLRFTSKPALKPVPSVM
ncbi:MAG: adenylyl-sulfate kinase [Luteolibacter sp.]